MYMGIGFDRRFQIIRKNNVLHMLAIAFLASATLHMLVTVNKKVIKK